jgi:hypothetical protein
MLLVAVFLVGYSFYPRRVEDEAVGICVHLEDYDNQTISNLIDLGSGWVRTDWTTPDDSMREYSKELQYNDIKLLVIIDHKTFGYRIPTLEEWNRTITELVNSEAFRDIDAVEIWNEPNSGDYSVKPYVYYEMLKSAYAIIKNFTSLFFWLLAE